MQTMPHTIRSLIGFSTLVCTLSTCMPVQAAAPNAPEAQLPPHISVTGKGEVRFKPDIAVITIGVVAEDKQSQAAVKANAASSQAVHAAVKGQGIDDKDIQTVNYSVQPIQEVTPNANRPPRNAGYRVYNQVQVRIHALDRIGAVLDAAAAAGSNAIENIAFQRENTDEYESQALAAAYADAKRKTESLAKASGNPLRSLLEISEGVVGRPIPIMTYGKMAADASTPISTGELTLTAQVTAVYAIDGRIAEGSPIGTKAARKLAVRPVRTASK